MDTTTNPTPAIVKRGRGYQGLDAWTVENPADQRFIPGRTVGISPPHEEAPSWRAILAGFMSNGDAIVVPLTGHFGELRARRILASKGHDSASMWLPLDAPSSRDECDWTEAKCLALSIAHALDLTGRDG